MRKLMRVAVTVVCVCAACAAAGEIKPDVWILSGQSNSCGWGPGEGLPVNKAVQMYDPHAKKWVPAKEPLLINAELQRAEGRVGAWHMAATQIAERGLPVNLTGWAQSGIPIRNWDDGQPLWTQLTNVIKQSGEGAGVFMYYQGESDAVENSTGEAYLAKLKNLVERVRGLARNPQMLVVIVQIGDWKGHAGTWEQIREAQRRFVVEDAQALLVPAMGRAVDPAAAVHLSREGYFELGKEIAKALLKVRYKQPKIDWPGPVLDAAVATDARTVVAHFAEVKTLKNCEAADFGIVKGTERIKCIKAVAQNTRVALTFESDVKPPARLVYGFGGAPACTLTDEDGNRAPTVELEITGGPPPDDKESPAPNGANAPPAVKKK